MDQDNSNSPTQEAAQKPKRSTMRKVVGWVGRIVVGIVLLLGVAGAATQTSWFKAFLRDKITEIANKDLNGRLEIGRIDGDLFTGAQLHDIKVFDGRNNLAVRLDHLKTTYGLLGILNDQLTVEGTSLDHATVVVRYYPDGVLNMNTISKPSKPKKKSEPSALVLVLKGIELKHGAVMYLDERPIEAGQPLHPSIAPVASFLSNDLIGLKGNELTKRFSALVLDTARDTAPRVVGAMNMEASLSGKVDLAGPIEITLASLRAGVVTDTLAHSLATTSDDLMLTMNGQTISVKHKRLMLGEGTHYAGLSLEMTLPPTQEASKPDAQAASAPMPFERIKASVDTIKVDHNLVNRILPDLGLLADIEASFKVSGTPEVLATQANIVASKGGAIALTATLNDVVPALIRGLDTPGGPTPQYSAQVNVSNVDTTLLMEGLPSLQTSLNAKLEGQGVDPKTLKATLTANVEQSLYDKYKLTSADLLVSADNGRVLITKGDIKSPYLDANLTGFATLAGVFDLKLKAARGDHHDASDGLGNVDLKEAQADVDLGVSGTLNLKAKDPLAMVTKADVEGAWMFRSFRIEDIVIGHHQAHINLNLTSPSDATRLLVYDINTTGSGIQTPSFSARSIAVDAKGSARLRVPMSDPIKVVRRLMLNANIKGQGVRAAGARLGRVNARVSLKPTDNGRLAYTLDTTLSGISMPSSKLKLARGSADIQGEFELGSGSMPLSWMSVKGLARIKDLDVKDTARVGGAVVDLDLQGRPPALAGKFNVAAGQVFAQGEHLATVKAQGVLTKELGFDIDLNAYRVGGRPNQIKAKLKGDISEDFKRIKLERVALSLPNGRTWSIQGASVNMQGDQLAFENLNLVSGEQRLSVQGKYNPRGAQNLKVEARNLNVGQLLRDVGLDASMPEVKGEVNSLDFSLMGTAKDPVIRIDTNLENFYYQGIGPFTLVLKGRYERDILTLTRADLDGYGENILDAQARLPMNLNLQTNKVEFFWDKNIVASAQLYPLVLDKYRERIPQAEQYQIAGELSAFATISGTLSKPTLDTLFKAKGLGFVIDTGEQTLRVKDMSIESRLDYKPPTNTQGGLVARGWIDWLNTEAELKAQTRRMTWKVSTPLPIAQWINDFIKKNETPLLTRDVLTKPFELAINVNAFNLSRIDIKPLFKQSDVAGIMSVALRGQGTFLKPDVDLKINLGEQSQGPKGLVTKGGLGWDRYRDIVASLNIALKDDMLKMRELKVNWDGADMLNASLELPLPIQNVYDGQIPNDFPVKAQVNVLPFPIEKLQAITYNFAGVPGVLKGQINIDGKLSEPTFQGIIELDKTQIGEYGEGKLEIKVEALKQVASLGIGVYKDNKRLLNILSMARVNLDVRDALNGGDPLKLAEEDRVYTPGVLPEVLTTLDDLLVSVRTYEGKALPIKSIAPKFLMKKFFRRYNGDIKADVLVSGKWNKLKAQGAIQVNNALFYVTELGRNFEKIDVDLAFKEDTIKVGLDVDEGPTWAQLEGTITHQNFAPQNIDLRASMDQFNVGGFVEFPFFASTDVDIKGNLASNPIEANVQIKNLNVILPENASSSLHDTSLGDDIVVLDASRRANANAFYDRLSKDLYQEAPVGALNAKIRVVLDKDSEVIHPEYGKVVFGGNVGVDLTNGISRLSGGIETVSGQAEFLGRKFSVARGSVTFTGSVPPNPRLLIEAENTLDRALIPIIGQPLDNLEPKAIIRISGTAQDPRLKLLSDPQMPDTDILYILATGRPPNSSGVGQDAGVASAALSAASGLFLGLLQQELKGKVPVQVSLEAGSEGLSDSAIEVGRYITEDIFVSYKHQFGGSTGISENIFSIDYFFAPRWMMEAQYSDSNQGQLNVFWDAL